MDLATYLKRHKLTPAKFARERGLSRSFVCRLVKGERQASPEMAKQIETATEGQVPKHILRPDIWDAPKRRAA